MARSGGRKSEQDIIAVYTDTVTNPSFVGIDNIDGRPHKPLNIEISQRSYAWSYEYAEDFILFDYSIKNIGSKKLNGVYMAVYVDGDVHHESMFGPEGYGEDLCGFRRTHPSETGCGFIDTINIAYITDNDGDPGDQGTFNMNSARGAAGIRVVRTPSDSLKYSFNWWAGDYDASSDFGPRQFGTYDDPFRDLNGRMGTPLGDANKYYVMRREEFDYDQLFVALDNTGDGWLPPPSGAAEMADGYDARYLLSFGPFEISPGEVLPVSFAWVLGDDVHTDPIPAMIPMVTVIGANTGFAVMIRYLSVTTIPSRPIPSPLILSAVTIILRPTPSGTRVMVFPTFGGHHRRPRRSCGS